MNGRMTARPPVRLDLHVRATMEPADERPDDVAGCHRAAIGNWPQWSRPMNGRMTVPR